MQKTAFIWDLDGTLLDSYEAILSGIEETFAQFSIPYDKEKVREFIFKYSVQDLLVQVAEDRNLDVEVLNQVRAQSLAEKNAQVVLMPGAREVLAWADKSGIQQFIYTHKGTTLYHSQGLGGGILFYRDFNQSEWLCAEAKSRRSQSGYLSAR